jgi:hypothetical protein
MTARAVGVGAVCISSHPAWASIFSGFQTNRISSVGAHQQMQALSPAQGP